MKNLNNFRDHLSMFSSQKTIQSRLYDLKQFFANYSAVNRKNVENYVRDMVAAGLDPKTISRKISSLSIYADFQNKPIGKIRHPKIQRKLPIVLNSTQLKMLKDDLFGLDITDFNNLTLRAMFVLLITSARIGEILNIRDTDIDFNKGEVRVTGKRGKEVVKPIIFGLGYLRDYINKKKEYNIRCPYLLVREYRGYYTHLKEREFRNMLYDFTSRVLGGLKVNPHAFRHTIATELLNNGANLRVVQELLGHSDIATTQIYTHVAKNALSEAVTSAHPFNN